jgi:hypothetical protein
MSFEEILGAGIMDRDDVKKRIRDEEDYIRCPKFGNSLARLRSKHPDGVEDHMIAKILMLTEQEIQGLYDEAVEMLKEGILDE